jgi:malonate transporter and related proteins
MLGVFLIIAPVFIVVAAGYLAVRAGVFRDEHVDGLMVFTQKFAVPCLLFRATMSLDLGAVFDWRLMTSFYTGAIISFTFGILGARLLFARRPGEAVSLGFAALFSNSVLLGLPIMERAFGPDSLAPNYAIVSIHAPLCYFLGITMMEISRADGLGPAETARNVLRAMFKNALMIGLALGFAVNLSGISLPEPVVAAVDMMARSALPAALFGVGGVLTRYRLYSSPGEVGMVTLLSLVVHPTITFLLCTAVFSLPDAFTRSAVMTASMAPGINSYVFASLYDRAKGEVASAVLIATATSILTISFWLVVLEHLT